MTSEVKQGVRRITIWIDADLKQQFKDFCATFNISLTDFLKLSGTYMVNMFKKNNPLTLNVFTTNLKDAVRSKRIKVMWDLSKQGRSVP